MVEYKLFGKIVHNPILKVLAVLTTVINGLLLLPFTPVLVLTHFVLKKLGRNGFYFDNRIWIGKKSFEKTDFSGPTLGQGFRYYSR